MPFTEMTVGPWGLPRMVRPPWGELGAKSRSSEPELFEVDDMRAVVAADPAVVVERFEVEAVEVVERPEHE